MEMMRVGVVVVVGVAGVEGIEGMRLARVVVVVGGGVGEGGEVELRGVRGMEGVVACEEEVEWGDDGVKEEMGLVEWVDGRRVLGNCRRVALFGI